MSDLTEDEMRATKTRCETSNDDVLKRLYAEVAVRRTQLKLAQDCLASPVPMRLVCPDCMALHLDVGEFATKPHHTHACQECGCVWRPAVVATVGVRFLPGLKNEEPLK